jgi:predicted MFS family arabinose efflux permease
MSIKNQKNQDGNKDNDYQKPIPDGGYGWLVLAGAFIISFLIDGIMYTFGIILEPIGKDTESSDKITNLLSCLNSGFLFFSGPVVSGFVNQFGVRSCVIGGGAITALMYMLTALTSSIYVMMMTYGIIGGISTGCCYLASLIIIPEYFDKRRGIATGITMAGSGVGSFVLPPVIRALIKANDWKFWMSVCACVLLECCVFGALLKPLNKRTKDNNNNSNNRQTNKVELKRLSTNLDVNNNNSCANANDDDTNTYDEYVNDNEDQNAKTIQTFSSGSMLSINKAATSTTSTEAACGGNFKRISLEILREMSNFKLLKKNKVFLLIVLSNFFCFLGYFTPFIYIIKVPLEYGSTSEQATTLLQIIGIVNIPFRMLFGMIADRKILSAVNLNTLCVSCVTLSLFLFPLLKSEYKYLIGFAVMFAIGKWAAAAPFFFFFYIIYLRSFPNLLHM